MVLMSSDRVKLAENIKNGEKCALKIMKRDGKTKKDNNMHLFKNEVRALHGASHENILKMYNYAENTVAKRPDSKTIPVAYMALEYAENGEIFDFISETGRFSEPVSRFYFRQLIEALDYMNHRGFSHRDIKPENILLDASYNLKLADFGFATKNRINSSRKGTAGYMAPEVLSGHEYDSKVSDIFSAGTVLFIMYTQFCPFINANKADRYYSKVIAENWDELWDMYEHSNTSDVPFSSEFKDLFQRLINASPDQRPSIEEIRNHDWMNGPMATLQEIQEEFDNRKLLRNTNLAPQNQKNAMSVTSDQKEEKKDKTKAQKATAAKEDKRYSRFFKVSDPEELVNVVVEFAVAQEYAFEKSDEYYRIEMTAVEAGESARITVNILKKPDDDSRCIQFLRVSGSKAAFVSAFTHLKHFLSKKPELD